MRISTKKIAYIALITAASIFLNTFDLSVAGGSFKIGLTYLPTFIAGFYFGPGAGCLVGVLGDVLGCLIWPKGPWLPLLTLSAALMGTIPGLVRYIKLDKKVILVISYLSTYFVCSLWLNSFALWQAYAATKKTFWVYMFGRIPTQLLNMIINMMLNLLTLPFFDKLIQPRLKGEKVASN